MKSAMLEHGLDAPRLAHQDDYFVVTLPGAGKNVDRIRVPVINKEGQSQLTRRQVQIVEEATTRGFVSTKWCTDNLDVTRDTAFRDLTAPCELGLLAKTGTGRGTKYFPGRATK